MADQGRGHLLRLRAELAPDPATLAWRARYERRRHGAALESLHRFLGRFASDWDVNAMLGTYAVHLLGQASWRALLGERAGGRLLDVGSGSGEVLAELAPLFTEVLPIETSRGMARRLRARFGRCEELDLGREPLVGHAVFDAVSLLNVLDRCERPRSLLGRALEALRSGGTLIVATPLPMRPHVDAGGETVDPDEPFEARGESWEASLEMLVARELEPRGLRIETWARAPYLSQGDTRAAFHEHDDAVVIATKAAY